MARVEQGQREAFFADVNEASKKAVWCAVATCDIDVPTVRIVHPTWEGETLWFATMTGSPKVRHMQANPRVDIQYQVAEPDFVHILVSGCAEIETDQAEKTRVWDVIDYDLGAFWPGGPTDPGYTLVRVVPERVELSKMFGMQDKRVWRRG